MNMSATLLALPCDTSGRYPCAAFCISARGVLIMISTPLAGYASRHILPGVSLHVRMI